MIKKIWNWIKNIFKPKRQEIDEHEELYLEKLVRLVRR